MKIKNKIYVYFDKLANTGLECFIAMNQECAMRWVSVRVAEAAKVGNRPLLTTWKDCKIVEFDLGADVIEGKEIADLSTFIDLSQIQESEKNA